MEARLDGIDSVTADDLRRAGRVLFVASTTGDGEPPDMALTFSRLTMQQPAPLAGLRYGLLALGDRSDEHTSELQSLMRISYAVFCLKKKKTKDNQDHQH